MNDKITRAGDRLGGLIEENLLQAVAQLDHAVFGFETRGWDVEDPAETEQDENDWPVIVVSRENGQRYSIHAMVTVNPEPALVDSQQPSPVAIAKTTTRKGAGKPLALDRVSCSKCGKPLIVGWVERNGAHADCDHLATMRASHPEWFADTADQTALPIDAAAGGAS